MALQKETGKPTEVTYTFVDVDAKQSTTTVYFKSDLTTEGLQTNVIALGALLAALSDCALVSASVLSKYLDIEALAAGPVNGAQVEEKAEFTFANAVVGQFQHTVPGLKESIRLPNTDALNIGTAAISNYVAFMTAADIDTAVAVSYFGQHLPRLIEAREAYRPREKKKRG